MITKAELDKMVDERAEMFTAHILNDGNWISIQKDCNSDILESAYIAGAKFVTGILQDEIDELKRSNVNLFDTVCDFERGIECLQSDRTKLENQLSEANATIQSLKDENKKFREALNECHKIAITGTNSASIKVTQIICKALTQKAEE